MDYPLSSHYDAAFVRENLMGPNAMKLLEELSHDIPFTPGMRVMDLSCGKGLTSLFLAKEFPIQVYAVDLWISEEENRARFHEQGADAILPVHCDVAAMPFENDFFDAIVCVDGYHYFGRDKAFLDEKIAPILRPGGRLALAVPGLKKEFDGPIPPEMLLSWTPEDLETIRSREYWADIFSASRRMEVTSLAVMESFDECWNDWLACDAISYAVNDRKSMSAGAGNYMNFVSAVLTRCE